MQAFPSSVRRRRRGLPAVVASAALALGVPAAFGTAPAQAVQTGPGVQPGHTIMVTPDIDFVGVYGYRSGSVIAVEIIRRNPGTGQDETIGRAVAPAVSTKTGVGLELNHGPTGTANTLGACWDKQTPDIRPGDRVLVTQGGQSDEVTVDTIRWTSAPAVDAATGDVVVNGVAQGADGSPIPAASLNGGQFRNDTGNYRIFPDLVESTGTAGEFRVHYRSPYTGFRNRDGLTADQRKAALLTGNNHMISYGDVTPPPPESQGINGLADRSGPAIGCEAAPAGVTPLAPHDATPPTVADRTPADGATDVAANTDITATFSEDVIGAGDRTFSLRSSSGVVPPATVTYDPVARRVSLHPTTPLKGGTTYTASLTDGVVDGSGNPLTPVTWTFTTAASSDTTPPTLAGTSPAAGATDVALDAPVTATFSEDVIGVDGNSYLLFGPDGGVAADVTYDSATHTATLTPTTPLSPGGAYTASLTSPITDTVGNDLPLTVWSFETKSAPDVVAPTVVDSSPAAGTGGVPRTGTVTATFSEDVTGVENGFSLIGPGGAVVPATVTYDPVSWVATLTPSTQLAASTTYTAAVSTAVTDPAGNALAPTSWSFTTVAAPSADSVPPTVTARTPAAQARGVAVGTTVTATFSEAVANVDGASFTLTGPGSLTVAATVAYDGTRRVATLIPSAPLAAGTSYTAALTNAITDTAGNRLAAGTWSFSTAGAATTDTVAPTVTTRSPANLATGVARGTKVTATFSEAVTGVNGTSFTLTSPIGAVPATVTYTARSRVATLAPSSQLAPGTRYTAALTDAIADGAGNRLAAMSWSFTTAGKAPTDTVAPTVTKRAPASGATGVRRNDNVTVTFSEAVTGVDSTSVTLRSSSGASVTATLRYNATSRVATLNPVAPLGAGEQYQVSLTNSIKDAAGNQLAATTWTFTTGRT